MRERKVVFGLVVVEDKDRRCLEAVFYRRVFKEFREKNFSGGVDDNVGVCAPVKFVRNARPVGEITEIFRDVNGAKKGDFGGDGGI